MGLSKPSKGIFWISLIIGLFAIVNQFIIHLPIPIISEIANIVLLAVAYILLVLGVIIKKL
jgi:uncharacterized membrane protein